MLSKICKELFLNIIGKGLIVGLISGLILGFADLYLGLLFAENNILTYLFIFGAYIAFCVLLGILVNFIINIFIKTNKFKKYHYAVYFICLLFCYDFVYANWKLFGGFDISNLGQILTYFINFKVIIINSILLTVMIFFIRFIYKVEKVGKYFLNMCGYLQFSFLAFNFIAAINYFLLRFPSSKSFLKILFITLFISAIPFFIVLIKVLIDTVLSILLKPKLIRQLIGSIIILVIVFSIPPIIRYPDFSVYKNKSYSTNNNRLTKLKNKPNIIWIVIDTARRDHLSCYGYHRTTTPNIDAFAKDGIIFNNYISTAPWTLPSHASMFTGMYSSKHGAHHAEDKLCIPLTKENLTLAEILTENGYKTAGIASNGVIGRANQFEQGFNFYFNDRSQFYNSFWGVILRSSGSIYKINDKLFRINRFRLSSEINYIVFPWLKKHKSYPFFIFVNYMESHYGVFHLPKPFSSVYNFNWSKFPKADLKKIENYEEEIDKETRQLIFDWLDCRIRFLDYNIGKFFSKLKDLKLYDNSLIILVSDHGEMYGEHNSFGHHKELYNEVINVPLIIKYPKSLNLKGVYNGFVQNVDLMPEILSLLGIPIPKEIQGQPIMQANHKIISEMFKNKWSARNNPERYYRDLKAIIVDDEEYYKYIQSSNGKSELYNFSLDPFEKHNLISQMYSKADILDKTIVEWQNSFKPIDRTEDKQKKMSKDLQERLKALGYIK